MGGIAKASAIVVATLAVQLAGPAAVPAGVGPSAELLAAAGCSGRSARPGSVLRARLAMAAAYAATVPGTPGEIPLLDGLGNRRWPVTTASPEAQRYFDQGMAFAYGFNHDAAIRSFRAAQMRDPACAMCFWGEALALGPNINAAMTPDALAQARAALERAQALASAAGPTEQKLIAALAVRYAPGSEGERPRHDQAYFDAMRALAGQVPGDVQVALLAAEAAMNTQPWDYWAADGRTPKGNAGWAIDRVDRALALQPDHPQAIHLQIHLLEASTRPGAGLAGADRLAAGLSPASGHLVHMPSHLYVRTGRYRDSIKVNREGAAADARLIATIGDKGTYRYGYYPHNVHFLLVSAQMAGDLATVEAESARLVGLMDVPTMRSIAWVQVIQAAPYFAHAQFSSPATILAQPRPKGELPYTMAMWHYSRALAHAAQMDEAGFAAELAALKTLRDTADWTFLTDSLIPAPLLLDIAQGVARGKLAAAKGDWKSAAGHYRKAAALEAQLPYAEPPYWYFPVNQSLGAALLKLGDARGAELAFLQALSAYPGNGWALYGLAEAQAAQGDEAGATHIRAALGRAWAGDPAQLRLERL